MATLHVRNVPDDLYSALRERADREGRSLNAEAIALLRRALQSPVDPDDLVRRLHEVRARLRWPEDAPPPEDLIREARDAR